MNNHLPKALYFWPGLAGLWLKGHWSSMALAFGFSLILNLALISTFVWPALLGPELKLAIWLCVAGLWVLGVWFSWGFMKQHQNVPETAEETDDTLFNQAQTEYLKGDFTQAESLLTEQLQIDSRDAEARLLLASIYRRTRRNDKARRELNNLQRIDTGIRWQFEIERERQRTGQTENLDDDDSLQDEDSSESSQASTIVLGESAAMIEDGTDHEDKQDTTIRNEQLE